MTQGPEEKRDRQTDRQTVRQTDIASSRVASPRLKIQLTAQQNCLSDIVQFPAQTGT